MAGTDDLKREERRKRERAFHAFIGLFRESGRLLNPPPGPANEGGPDANVVANLKTRLTELHDAAYSSSYMRQFDPAAIRSVLRGMESSLGAARGESHNGSDMDVMRRELLFLYRFAQIVKWKDFERTPPDLQSLGRDRKKIAAMCLDLESLLLNQLEDTYLLRKIRNDDMDRLPGLITALGRFSEVFAEIKPEPPYDRNRVTTNTVMRIVIDDLVECCYRIYEVCDVALLRKLLRATWLRAYAGVRSGELTEMINGTLGRKQTEYFDRTEPVTTEATALSMPWMPARNL
jgi:hypothetical protein